MDRMIIFLLVLASCRTPAPAPQPETREAAAATLPATEENVPPSLETNLTDPSPQELQRLGSWLSAQETGFELERLEDCAAQLLVRADRVQNKADIQKAADDMQADVRESLPLYHWCYFHMLSRLEYQLEQENLGRSYQDKLQQFLRESKALFIAAECLDRTRQTRRYRTTLQKKYIALSQAHFGRQLSPMESTRPETKRPAGPFREK